jgi:hypothetical protein
MQIKEPQGLRLHPEIKNRLHNLAKKQNIHVAKLLDRWISEGLKREESKINKAAK